MANKRNYKKEACREILVEAVKEMGIGILFLVGTLCTAAVLYLIYIAILKVGAINGLWGLELFNTVTTKERLVETGCVVAIFSMISVLVARLLLNKQK